MFDGQQLLERTRRWADLAGPPSVKMLDGAHIE
jgi:hypothetical protein